MSTQKNNSGIFVDNYGRRMDYLRLAVTDRCNLRCQYCMPEEGIKQVSHTKILSFEEMHRLCRILAGQGVRKIRITGGEPLVRKELVPFLKTLTELQPQPEIGMTTNGVLLDRYLDDLKVAGITNLNISLDSLSPETFFEITRRDNFWDTWNALKNAIAEGFNIKINVVIQPGINDHEIADFVRLTSSLPITVRFIEPMPFSGTVNNTFTEFSGERIKKILENFFDLEPVTDETGRVANRFSISGHEGFVGIIYAYSRTFCATCSRIRISAQGQMRTCLYGQNVLDLRELLRCGSSDEVIIKAVNNVLQHRFTDGFEAGQNRSDTNFESMSAVGG